jgi:hypothetical protein
MPSIRAVQRGVVLLATSCCLLWPKAGICLVGQGASDPLTNPQADQVRELGTNPTERVKLYLKFVNQRVDEIEQLAKDSHENNRPAELRARYDEFTRLTDELSENIDTYHEDHADIRKALRQVASKNAHWSEVLNAPPPDRTYDFARRTALNAAASCGNQVQKLLADEEAYFTQHKDQAGKNGEAPSPEE